MLWAARDTGLLSGSGVGRAAALWSGPRSPRARWLDWRIGSLGVLVAGGFLASAALGILPVCCSGSRFWLAVAPVQLGRHALPPHPSSPEPLVLLIGAARGFRRPVAAIGRRFWSPSWCSPSLPTSLVTLWASVWPTQTWRSDQPR